MRKLAANYLVSDTGGFLKNGMALVGDDGLISQFIDTEGNLNEVEQLIFHNGILMGGCQFVKINDPKGVWESENRFRSAVFHLVPELTQLLSIHDLIDLGKELQLQFREMKIPTLMDEISQVLLEEGGFVKETIPGIYLLKSVDLVQLHFIPKSRLKQIL